MAEETWRANYTTSGFRAVGGRKGFEADVGTYLTNRRYATASESSVRRRASAFA
jgi:hypothetical protein